MTFQAVNIEPQEKRIACIRRVGLASASIA